MGLQFLECENIFMLIFDFKDNRLIGLVKRNENKICFHIHLGMFPQRAKWYLQGFLLDIAFYIKKTYNIPKMRL